MAYSKLFSPRRRKIWKLMSQMNKQNIRFIPLAPPLIDMMDMTTTDEELDFLLKLGTDYYTYQQLLRISGMTDQLFEVFFDTLMRKGLLHPKEDQSGARSYRVNAIAVGWYEAMMHYLMGRTEERAFSEKFIEYFKLFKKFNIAPFRGVQNMATRQLLNASQGVGIIDPETPPVSKRKTIPINAAVNAPESAVYPTSYINELVDRFGDQDAIYVFPCVCRHATSVLGEVCSQEMPRESCIAFGNMARSWAEFGYGRNIDKKEAMDILKEVRDKGAVHTVIHERDDPDRPVLAVCNCCWDCCGILKSYNMGAVPLKYKSYYLAKVRDAEKCKGCRSCEKYCPTTAAKVVNKQSVISHDRCIGCGQCAYQCRQNNIELVPEERIVFLPTLKRSEVRVSA